MTRLQRACLVVVETRGRVVCGCGLDAADALAFRVFVAAWAVWMRTPMVREVVA